MEDVIGIISIIGWLGSSILLFVVLSTLYKENGFGSAFLGFIVPIYTFFWGWFNLEMLQSSHKNHKKIMVVWTIFIAMLLSGIIIPT